MKLYHDQYAQVDLQDLAPRTRAAVSNLRSDVIRTMQTEYPGSWELGSEWDRKGRGWKTTAEIIHVGKDTHNSKLLIILRMRQVWRNTAKGYLNQHKSYFLCGRNEDGGAFAHPVQAQTVRSAINKGKDPIRAVQDWMFQGDYSQMLRQGDHGLFEANERSKDFKQSVQINTFRLTLQDSHLLEADEIWQGEGLYAYNPALTHLKGEHPDIDPVPGWWRIVEAQRAETHDFAPPTID